MNMFIFSKTSKQINNLVPNLFFVSMFLFILLLISNSFVQIDAEILSPKKQLANGILPPNVICKEGMNLVFKSNTGYPNCVKQSSVDALFERGWAHLFYVSDLRITEFSSNKLEGLNAGEPTNVEFFVQNKIHKQYSVIMMAKIQYTSSELYRDNFEEIWRLGTIGPNLPSAGAIVWQPCFPGKYSVTFEILDNLEKRSIMATHETLEVTVSGEAVPDCQLDSEHSSKYD